jgi:carboxyl-terminal processing protease
MRNPFVHLLITLFAATILAQPAFAQSKSDMPELECKYLDQIQQIYLMMHVKYSKADSGMQERVIEQYLKKLDPSKVNLLESDVALIRKTLANIFEDVKKKDCSALDKTEQIVLEKVKARSEFAKKLLGADFKFDPKTEFVFDPQKKPFPKTEKEAEEFLRKYIQFQISNYLAADQKLDEAKANVMKSWDRNLKRLTEEKKEDIFAMYLDAFALALDPHSSYFSRDVNEDFQIQMRLALDGIGATLSSQDGFTVVESMVPGGPAMRSGLVKKEDKIIAVGQGDSGPMENVIEMDLRDVVKKIRGKKGTKVRLLIMRKQGETKEKLEINIIRDHVKLDDEAAQIHYVEKDINGTKHKLAVLDLPSFYADSKNGGRSVASDTRRLIGEARAAKAEGLILDLSNNGGGSLDDAVKVAGLFFATGNVVKQSSREESGHETTLKDKDPTVDWNGPLVVLTSRISASASEIVSGTLKDYKRAVIVGSEHTFGKGSVQQVMDIPTPAGEFGSIKVTVGMFFTPGGFSTQHRGVEADVKIPGPYDQDDIGEKYLDYSLPPKKLEPFLSTEAYVKEGTGAWVPLEDAWLKSLAEKSKLRVAKSDDFKKIVDDLNKEKNRAKVIKVADAVKDKEKRDSKKQIKNAATETKEKEYLKRPEVQESINVLMDLLSLETKVIHASQ